MAKAAWPTAFMDMAENRNGSIAPRKRPPMTFGIGHVDDAEADGLA
jgi:hypothetical protein